MFLELPEPGCFLHWELCLSFSVLHRQSICIVDCVDLIYNLLSWWVNYHCSSLVVMPLGHRYNFSIKSTCVHQKSVPQDSCRTLRSALVSTTGSGTAGWTPDHATYAEESAAMGRNLMALIGLFSSLWWQKCKW